MRPAPLLHVLGCSISFTFMILAAIRGDVQLSLLGSNLFILTWLVFGLRELLIFLVILWKQMKDKGVLLIVGLRTGFLIDFALFYTVLTGITFDLPPFSILGYNPTCYMIGMILPVILLLVIGMVWLIAEQKLPPTLPIGKSWVSQWQFNIN
ncbi:MAG: hypothetical protein ACFFDT_18590 [Candidatus Hodarchaeota archaeon]